MSEQDKTIGKHFTFDRQFQEKILQAMIFDRVWASQFAEVLDVGYFEHAYLKMIANKYVGYQKQYKEFPSQELLRTIIIQDLKSDRDAILRQQVQSFLVMVAKGENLGDMPYVKDRALEFCRKQGLQMALEKSVDLIVNEDYDKVATVIKHALAQGMTTTPGLELGTDIDTRYSETFRSPIKTGIAELDSRQILNGGLGAGEIGTVISPSGCHAKGTKILMFGGNYKNVEEVKVGDLLMGPDSQPRKVLNLVSGKDDMYKIIPVKGKPFTVNKAHVLSLWNLEGKKIVNKTVEDYILSKNKPAYKLYRSQEIDFHKNDVLPIEPYVLGLLLGDGSFYQGRIEITTADREIKQAFYNFAKGHNQTVAKHPKKGNKATGYYLGNFGLHNNKMRNSLVDLGIFDTQSGTKFIPEVYKTSSKKERLEILAGLLDTDGHKAGNCYDFISKSEKLANDVVFLCQSLGLAAYVKPCVKTIKKLSFSGTYFRVTISGNTDMIPCRLERKRSLPRKQIKNVLHTGFSCESVGRDSYYGFTVDKDNLYVMEDFFVTHNCGKSHILVGFGAEAIKRGKNVIHYSFEMRERVMGVRYDSYLCDINSLECSDNIQKIKDHYQENAEAYGKLIIKEFPTRTATVQTLHNHVDRLALTGFRPDLIIVDYSGIMRSTEKYELPRMELQRIFEELRGLAQELNVPIWTATQSNKEGGKQDFIDSSNMAESYGQSHACDVIFGFNRKSESKATGFGTFFIAKNRAGKDGIQYHVHLDTSRSKLKFVKEVDMEDMIENSNGVKSGGAHKPPAHNPAANYMRTLFKESQKQQAENAVKLEKLTD